MVYFYQLFLNTDNVILKLYTSLCQKAKCTLFVWSTVCDPKYSFKLAYFVKLWCAWYGEAFLLMTSTPGMLSVRGDSNFPDEGRWWGPGHVILGKLEWGYRSPYPRIRSAGVPIILWHLSQICIKIEIKNEKKILLQSHVVPVYRGFWCWERPTASFIPPSLK